MHELNKIWESRQTDLARQRFNAKLEAWQPQDIAPQTLKNLSQHLFPETICGRCFKTGGIFIIDPRGNIDQIPENGLNFGAHLNGNPEGYFTLMYRLLDKNCWEKFTSPITIVSGERKTLFESLRQLDPRFAQAVEANRFW